MTAETTSPSTAPTEPPSTVRRWLVPTARIAAIVLLGMLVALVGLRVARAGALPGVTVADIDVSRLKAAQLHDRMAAYGSERAAAAVTVTRPPVPEAGATEAATVSASGAELGYTIDVDATVSAILRRGRQLNPIAALWDQLRAFGGTLVVAPVERVDDALVDRWVSDAARRLQVDPVEGTLVFEGTRPVRVEPRPGAGVDEARLRAAVLSALLNGGATDVTVGTQPLTPLTTTADVDAVAELAQQALSAPVRLHRGDATLVLSPADLAAIFEVERVVNDDDVSLKLAVSPDKLVEQVPDEIMATIERDPVDARFDVTGTRVRVIPGEDGFAFDAEAAAAQITELATGTGERSAELTGETLAPELGTVEARGMGITEQVSTFTTEYPCCQSRVRNIQRIADLVDGVVIRRGETFSLNGHVGERTVEKGFATGGAIYDGEFVEQIGGGVSQFATTIFNAAFFGGYAIPDYKAHSYYISRYPVGREATLNWPNVDLKVHNNSPHGLLVKTSHTATSVTVSFYGTSWVEVGDITGPRTNPRSPQIVYRENPDLPPGSERVVQSGRDGFDITVTRILTLPDGREERERFFTRYLAEPRIIERNSASPTPDGNGDDDGDGEPSPSPTPAPSPGAEAPTQGTEAPAASS